MKKTIKRVDVVVYKNSTGKQHTSDVIGACLGYEPTQAYMCAMLVHNNGNYVVKKFKKKELEIARNTVSLMIEKGLDARLLFA